MRLKDNHVVICCSATIALLVFVAGFPGCGPRNIPAHLRSSSIENDDAVKTVLVQLEQIVCEVVWFKKQSENRFGWWTNVCLVASIVVSLTGAALETSRIWKQTNRIRLGVLLACSLGAAALTGCALFLKLESDRFELENRSEYKELAGELRGVLHQFYELQYRRGIVQQDKLSEEEREERDAFLDKAEETIRECERIKSRYADKFHLEVYPDIKRCRANESEWRE